MSEKKILPVKIISNASKNEIIGWQNGFLKIKIKAQREKGKANLALISFLAKLLDIPKSNITIVKGKTASLKTLAIQISAHSLKNLSASSSALLTPPS